MLSEIYRTKFEKVQVIRFDLSTKRLLSAIKLISESYTYGVHELISTE